MPSTLTSHVKKCAKAAAAQASGSRSQNARRQPQPQPPPQPPSLQSPDHAALLALHLSFNTTHNVLICTLCGIVLDPAYVVRHWNYTKRADDSGLQHQGCKHSAKALIQALGNARPLAPNSLSKPSPHALPIPHLRQAVPGWKCTQCNFAASVRLPVEAHISAMHPSTSRASASAQRCTIQRWNSCTPCFEVGAAEPIASELPDEDAAEGQAQVSAVLRRQPEKRQSRALLEPQPQPSARPEPHPEPPRDAPPQTVLEASPQLQPNPIDAAISSAWEERTRRFALMLQDGDRVKLALLAQPGLNTSKLAVERATRSMIQAGCDVMSSIPTFVLKRLAKFDEKYDPRAPPFASVSGDALDMCAAIWSRVMLFLLRAYEQCDSEETASDGLRPAWRVLSSLDPGTFAGVANLSNDDAAVRQTAMLHVSSFCIRQPLLGKTQNSALIIAFTSLCVYSAEEWLPSTDAIAIIEGLLWCSRLFSLLSQLTHWKLWDPATLAFTPEHNNLAVKSRCWETFEDFQRAALCFKSDTAIPCLAAIADLQSKAGASASAEQGASAGSDEVAREADKEPDASTSAIEPAAASVPGPIDYSRELRHVVVPRCSATGDASASPSRQRAMPPPVSPPRPPTSSPLPQQPRQVVEIVVPFRPASSAAEELAQPLQPASRSASSVLDTASDARGSRSEGKKRAREPTPAQELPAVVDTVASIMDPMRWLAARPAAQPASVSKRSSASVAVEVPNPPRAAMQPRPSSTRKKLVLFSDDEDEELPGLETLWAKRQRRASQEDFERRCALAYEQELGSQ